MSFTQVQQGHIDINFVFIYILFLSLFFLVKVFRSDLS